MQNFIHKDILQFILNIYIDHNNIQKYRNVFKFNFLLGPYITYEIEIDTYGKVYTYIDKKIIRFENYTLSNGNLERKILEQRIRNNYPYGRCYKIIGDKEYIQILDDENMIKQIMIDHYFTPPILDNETYSLKNSNYKISKTYRDTYMILEILQGTVFFHMQIDCKVIEYGKKYVITPEGKIITGWKLLLFGGVKNGWKIGA